MPTHTPGTQKVILLITDHKVMKRALYEKYENLHSKYCLAYENLFVNIKFYLPLIHLILILYLMIFKALPQIQPLLIKANKDHFPFSKYDKTQGKMGEAQIFHSERGEELTFLTEDCGCIEKEYLLFTSMKIIACARLRQITIKNACQIPKGNNRVKKRIS